MENCGADERESEAMTGAGVETTTKNLKKSRQEVPATEFMRFIFRCDFCKLGFKRRGMLVAHFAKKHPDIDPNAAAGSNLQYPILERKKFFACPICRKDFSNSTKRRRHVELQHPNLNTVNEFNYAKLYLNFLKIRKVKGSLFNQVGFGACRQPLSVISY